MTGKIYEVLDPRGITTKRGVALEGQTFPETIAMGDMASALKKGRVKIVSKKEAKAKAKEDK